MAAAEEVQQEIEKKLTYDEYAWQREQKIQIRDEKRAEGLELPLYQCIACGTKSRMQTKGKQLYCNSCKAVWEMDEYGTLKQKKVQLQNLSPQKNVQSQIHIPDWYEWERAQVEAEIQNETYTCDYSVQVEALYNEKGFVMLGEGHLVQTREGFHLTIEGREHFFSSKARESVQTEYNYRGKGPCIVLSNQNCCYYLSDWAGGCLQIIHR